MANYAHVPLALRRYGGMRAHNKRAKIIANDRRARLARLRLEHPNWRQYEYASALNCHRTTVCRDLQILRNQTREEAAKRQAGQKV